MELYAVGTIYTKGSGSSVILLSDFDFADERLCGHRSHEVTQPEIHKNEFLTRLNSKK